MKEGNSDEEAIRKRMEWATLAEVEAMQSGYAKVIDRLIDAGVKITKPPVLVKIRDTNTVIGEYEGENLNFAVGSVNDSKIFDTITIKDKVYWAYNSDALKHVKRKLLEARRPKSEYEKRKEERKQVTFVPEYGGLTPFIEEDTTMEKEEEVKEEEKAPKRELTLSEAIQEQSIDEVLGDE